MNRRNHARPMTRREAERLGLYLAPRQPRRVRRTWWASLSLEAQVAALAIPLAVLVGILVTVVMGDLVWVPRP